jgi:transcriptional activator of cad operon
MRTPPTVLLRIADWCLNPSSGEMSRDGQTVRLEVRTMRLLLCLARQPGEVVSIDALLNEAWSGVAVSQDSVYQAIASLRRLFGDDPKDPKYIETVPRLGYRLVAAVTWPEDPSTSATGTLRRSESEPSTPPPDAANTVVAVRRRVAFMWTAGATAVCLVGVAAFLSTRNARDNREVAPAPVSQPLKSIAVLPFQDLTEEMTAEPFADGITVELINKLSKIPGLRVHAPMSPSALNAKKWTVAGMAKMLGVAYVVDGSVRKSTNTVRIAARLIHAEDEYVVWSETYDRPVGDVLTVQDNIAREVTQALKSQPPLTVVDPRHRSPGV